MQNFLQLEKQSHDSKKLTKLHYLLQNSLPLAPSKELKTLEKPVTGKNSKDFYKNFSLCLELLKKPLNLVFSMDQFFFEFSKKTYQQQKAGEFLQQLKERKKLSLFYGYLTQKQITSLFEKAQKKKGSFSKNVLCLLEQRLDVVLFRCGMVETIAEARQVVKHKKILVNQTPITSASYLLEPGDTVSISPEFLLEIKKKLGSLHGSKLLNLEKQHYLDKPSFIYQDFYKKLKTNLKTTGYQRPQNSFADKSRILSSVASQNKLKSHFLSKFLIQLLCIQMRSRSYLNLRTNFQKTAYLTSFKWKNSPGVDLSFLKKNQISQKQEFSSKKQKGISLDKPQELLSQIHEFGATRETLKKKSIFWKSWFTQFKHHHFVALKKNQKIGNNFNKSESVSLTNLSSSSQWNQLSLKLYRNNFLLFLKNLNFLEKFSELVPSQMIKFLFKKNLSGPPLRISKVNHRNLCKPMHFEVSYKLFELIYLYSPQRIQYPFSIDLDLIKRSLR